MRKFYLADLLHWKRGLTGADRRQRNVDRQLALYQAIFPDTYVQPCRASSPTFTVEEGEMLDADSRMIHNPFPDQLATDPTIALTPFHRNAQGDFWTSSNSRYVI